MRDEEIASYQTKIYKNDFLNQLMKKWISFFILLSSISFVSAQNTFGDLLNQIDQTTLLLYAVFIISFSLLFFALSKFFKESRAIAGLISAAIALLLTYAVNKSGLDIQGFVFGLGISQDALATAIPIVILLGSIFIIIKLAKNSLLVLGGLLILASFFVYEQTALLVLGIILVGIRFFIPKGKWEMKKKDFKNRGAGI
jgi:hypothetical protein